MIRSRVRVELNQTEINTFLHSPAGPVVREISRVGRLVQNEAKRRAPVDEGTLRASIGLEMRIRVGRVTARIGTNLEYAFFVHEGTGLFGATGALIRPKTAQVLRFKPRNPRGPTRRGFVYARYVRGMRGRPFLVDALIAVSPWPVTRLST